jgi:hypothetical protein
MRLFDLFETALPLAAMKSVTVPGAGSLGISPETLAVIMFAAVALVVIYVFMR